MVMFDDGRSYHRGCYCPYCGSYIGTGDYCCTTTTTATIYGNAYYDSGSLVKIFEDIPWKLAFFEWLHKIFPFRFDDVDKIKSSFVGIKKKYNRRILFAKSGYLPGRIRGIRK